MKFIITLLFISFISVTSFASNTPAVQKVVPISKAVVLESATNVLFENKKEVKENAVARLYRFKNSRILKELNFRTKSSRNNRA